MPPPARALLIHNPESRAGSAAAAAAASSLAAAGVRLERHACEGRDETIVLLRARHAEVDAVVACGGDGTMNTVANALAGTGTPLGIIPAGTANDLARTLGVPEDVEAAAAIVTAGHRRAIDLGEVNGFYFLNVASIGLSVDLARELTPGIKRRFGKLGYALAALRVAMRARPFRAMIAGPDSVARVRSYQIAVGNGRFYGGGMAVAEDASISDARLDFYSLEVGSIWRLALMLPAFRAGSHGLYREVRTAAGPWFEVRTRRPRPVNADGELLGTTPARFRVHPSALSVFAPGVAE